MSRAGIEAVVLLLLLAACVFGGYEWGERDQSVLTTLANHDKDTCVDAAQTKQTALDRITSMLKQQRDDHDAMRKATTDAIAKRDNQITALNQAVTAAQKRAEKATHEDPDCVALSRLGVCPAVARELWPVAAAPNGAH